MRLSLIDSFCGCIKRLCRLSLNSLLIHIFINITIKVFTFKQAVVCFLNLRTSFICCRRRICQRPSGTVRHFSCRKDEPGLSFGGTEEAEPTSRRHPHPGGQTLTGEPIDAGMGDDREGGRPFPLWSLHHLHHSHLHHHHCHLELE